MNTVETASIHVWACWEFVFGACSDIGRRLSLIIKRVFIQTQRKCIRLHL